VATGPAALLPRPNFRAASEREPARRTRSLLSRGATALDSSPSDSRKWRNLYRGRTAVERVNGRLKDLYGLTPLRTRGLERVQLHADLTMLALLASRLALARAAPVAA
jgi:transposase